MQYNIFQNWLERSGINNKTQELFDVKIGHHKRLGSCIEIPVHDEGGNYLFSKYRKNPTLDDQTPKYMYDHGGTVTLYGYHLAKDHDTILVTEGEKDCLVAWSNNIPAVSSTGGALSFQKDWAPFFKDKNVILCFDNDETGGNGMAKVLQMIPHAKVLFIPDRPNVKDLADYVASGGDIHTLLTTARHFENIAEVKEDKAKRIAQYQNTYFHNAYIKKNTRPKTVFKGTITSKGDDLTQVKEVAIKSLITTNHSNMASCIWHNDKTPSLKVYEDSNTFYCFGCGKYGDVIDVYRQLHNTSFPDTIKALKRLLP